MSMFFTNHFNKTRFDKKRRPLSSKKHEERIFMRWCWKKVQFCEKKTTRDRLEYNLVKKKTFISRRNEGLSRVVNRCIFTDTPHSVNKQFRVSRMTFKEMVSFRYLTGITQLPVKK